MDEKELKERMLRENPQFREIDKEHQSYEKRLEDFKAKDFLSDDELIREKELKKRKLVLKDRMYRMMAEFRKSL